MGVRNLHLTLTKRWFDMILSGEKTEEYREIKRHWIVQLLSNREYLTDKNDIDGIGGIGGVRFKHPDTITFRNGYSKNAPTMTVECKGIKIGEGNPNWGAEPNTEYFVISLGKILETKNIVNQ